MEGQYSAGFMAFCVCRGRGPGRKQIDGIYRIDLPALPIPVDAQNGSGFSNAILRLHFLSALDAVEAMKDPQEQVISIRAAEEYWNLYEAKIGTRSIEHVLRVKPKTLVPAPISSQYSAKVYQIPENEKKKRKFPGDEVEPLSFQQNAYGGNAACEYSVYYYAAYCDGETLWEVDPKKRIFTIGGTPYPFPDVMISG